MKDETKQFDWLCALLPHGALWGDMLTPAIVEGICEAIAAQPQAEPVAWQVQIINDDDGIARWEECSRWEFDCVYDKKHTRALYAAPQSQPAVPPVPQAEPVAWINHYACMPPRIDSAATAGARRSEPLFAQPPAPRAAPLTDAQIVECAEESNIRTDLWTMGAGSLVYSDDCNGIPRSDFTNFVRAIERAHGIKGDSNA